MCGLGSGLENYQVITQYQFIYYTLKSARKILKYYKFVLMKKSTEMMTRAPDSKCRGMDGDSW